MKNVELCLEGPIPTIRSGAKARLTVRTKRIWAGAWRTSEPRMVTKHDL